MTNKKENPFFIVEAVSVGEEEMEVNQISECLCPEIYYV